MHPLLKNIAATVFLVLAALGLGLYVFPTQQWLAWGLLFLCWACFRLSMRANRLFGPRRAVPPPPEEQPEVGRKGGATGSSIHNDAADVPDIGAPLTVRDRLMERYTDWHESDLD